MVREKERNAIQQIAAARQETNNLKLQMSQLSLKASQLTLQQKDHQKYL